MYINIYIYICIYHCLTGLSQSKPYNTLFVIRIYYVIRIIHLVMAYHCNIVI